MVVNNSPLLAAQEDFATYVAAITGMRTQLINAGWSREVAEQIVLTALQTAAMNAA